MASPGSVVEIDKHIVSYKIRGKSFEKECFRRDFVCFKACWQGFLNGCRRYLAVDATALNGRWRGQLAAASAVDGHNWLFPVAFGALVENRALVEARIRALIPVHLRTGTNGSISPGSRG